MYVSISFNDLILNVEVYILQGRWHLNFFVYGSGLHTSYGIHLTPAQYTPPPPFTEKQEKVIYYNIDGQKQIHLHLS